MHAVGLHSALAIRRERRRRAELARSRERRSSAQSSESGATSPHCSSGSLDQRRPRARTHPPDQEVVSSVGMLHLGVVFLVLGVFLVASGWLPDDVTSWSAIGSVSWFNELVCSGLFALVVGVFLIVLHKVLIKSEEDALEDYVQRQLTRSRSGHRLERDAETGGMHTKHARRAKAAEEQLRGGGGAGGGEAGEAEERAHGFVNALALGSVPHSPLEKITEEPETRFRDPFPPTGVSLSPPSPSDTRELLSDPRYMVMSRM